MKRLLLLVPFLLFANWLLAQPRWECHSLYGPYFNNGVQAIAAADTLQVWIGTAGGLYFSDNGDITSYILADSSFGSNNIHALAHRNGTTWIGTDVGLFSISGGVITPHVNNGLGTMEIWALEFDSQGGLWIGTPTEVVRFHNNTIESHLFPAFDLAIDRLDRVWIRSASFGYGVGQDHLHMFDGAIWHSFSTDSFSPQNNVLATDLVTYKTTVYLGTTTGYYSYDGTVWTEVTVPEHVVSSIAVDFNRVCWFGLKRSGSVNPIDFTGLLAHDGQQFKAHWLDIDEEAVTSFHSSHGHLYLGTENSFVLGDVSMEPMTHYLELNINNIKAGFNADNRFFTSPYQEYDKRFSLGSEDSVDLFFISSLWISARESVNDTVLRVAAERFFGSDYFSGPHNNFGAIYRNPVIKLTKAQIELHKNNYNQPGYVTPPELLDWPANGNPNVGEALDLARFADVNSNGYYDPYNGDYPIIRGDQAVYFIMNDSNRPHTSSGGPPVGVEVHVMAYAFDAPGNDALDNTIFMCFDIVNRSELDYGYFKVGLFSDFNIGVRSDDYIGCDSILNLYYGYNGDNLDEDGGGEKGFGLNPPVAGVKMLSDSLSNFQYWNIAGPNPSTTDPITDQDYDNNLNSRWNDGSHLTWGGNGYDPSNPSSVPTNYAYSGDPVAGAGWTEASAGNTPNSRRGSGSIPSFALAKGERRMVDMALGVAREPGVDNINNITFFKSQMTDVQTFYEDQDWEEGVFATVRHPLYTGVEEQVQTPSSTRLYPNPSTGVLHLQSAERLNSIQVFSLDGRLVDSFLLNGNYNFSVNLPTSFKRGVYVVKWATVSGKVGTEKLILVR